ncbi:MAG TPA: di-heme oxidoredictase family protein [Vicinamibacterales bacterium]|nr:di-heme oxidoredictase family protein [Vicinamibacterales bacterium]
MKRSRSATRTLLVVVTAGFLGSFTLAIQGQSGATEAPAGFDNHPVPGFYGGDAAAQQAAFDADRAVFEERDDIAGGLGPVYNAQSCAECHQNPVTGAGSQISELRAGHQDVFGNFVDAPGGSLINDRATNANIQERVPGSEDVRTFRMTTNAHGDGFVEAINSNTLVAIANAQPGQSGGAIRGQVIQVPVLESPGNNRVGRFGWKNQHASLLSFSSDAYLNEMGITNRFNLVENTSLGKFVGFGSGFDPVADNAPCNDPNRPGTCGEDPDDDIFVFARFMRATKAPPRDTALAATADAIAGANLFNQIGCNICHVTSITTATPGSSINGGALTVSAALGNKVIHPYSDFLLHDIDSGDGIVQNGGQSTANKLRTQPLWGVRTHSRHMHDGESLTFNEAILRHGGEATFVTNNYRGLSSAQKNQLITFLKSL